MVHIFSSAADKLYSIREHIARKEQPKWFTNGFKSQLIGNIYYIAGQPIVTNNKTGSCLI